LPSQPNSPPTNQRTQMLLRSHPPHSKPSVHLPRHPQDGLPRKPHDLLRRPLAPRNLEQHNLRSPTTAPSLPQQHNNPHLPQPQRHGFQQSALYPIRHVLLLHPRAPDQRSRSERRSHDVAKYDGQPLRDLLHFERVHPIRYRIRPGVSIHPFPATSSPYTLCCPRAPSPPVHQPTPYQLTNASPTDATAPTP
jgi:hypothetical protein